MTIDAIRLASQFIEVLGLTTLVFVISMLAFESWRRLTHRETQFRFDTDSETGPTSCSQQKEDQAGYEKKAA